MSSGYHPHDPAPPAASPLASSLEGAHAELRRATAILEHDVPPVLDLGDAAGALSAAFAALYDAFDGRADPLGAVVNARAALEHAGARVADAADRDAAFAPARDRLAAARAHLMAAEERLARVAPPIPPTIGDLLASQDEPRVHAIARASLAPAVKIPAPQRAEIVAAPEGPIAPPTTFEELGLAVAKLKQRGAARSAAFTRPPPRAASTREEPLPPPGFALVPPPPMSDAAFIHLRTREHFEEVAMVGTQRAPLLGDPWRTALMLERRMLASIDVIAALGAEAIAHVPRLVADAPVKDASRGFGLAMILGCIAGRDAFGAIERVLSDGEADPVLLAGIAAALQLVPHAALPMALRSWLGEGDPLLRALALDVLAYRGLATPDELVGGAADHAKVAARALVPLALGRIAAPPGLLEAASESDDEDLRRAAWTARVLAAHPHTVGALFAALDGPDGETAAMLVAIGGDEADARALVTRALEAPRRALITPVGWVGAASSLVPLVDLLASSADDEVRLAAAYALDRITDAGLWEETEVTPEEILVAEPPEPDVGEKPRPKLADVVSDPRDRPAKPAVERVEQPSTNPERWRAHLRDHATSYDPRLRYRRGQPFSPAVVHRELDVARVTPIERRWLMRELVVRTGDFVRADPHDLVIVQERAMEAWRPVAAQASSQPGRWTRPARR